MCRGGVRACESQQRRYSRAACPTSPQLIRPQCQLVCRSNPLLPPLSLLTLPWPPSPSLRTLEHGCRDSAVSRGASRTRAGGRQVCDVGQSSRRIVLGAASADASFGAGCGGGGGERHGSARFASADATSRCGASSFFFFEKYKKKNGPLSVLMSQPVLRHS